MTVRPTKAVIEVATPAMATLPLEFSWTKTPGNLTGIGMDAPKARRGEQESRFVLAVTVACFSSISLFQKFQQSRLCLATSVGVRRRSDHGSAPGRCGASSRRHQ